MTNGSAFLTSMPSILPLKRRKIKLGIGYWVLGIG
jgi:hypothetical protein